MRSRPKERKKKHHASEQPLPDSRQNRTKLRIALSKNVFLERESVTDANPHARHGRLETYLHRFWYIVALLGSIYATISAI